MRPFRLTLILLLIAVPSFAQSQKFDSLQDLLRFQNPDGSLAFEVVPNEVPGSIQVLIQTQGPLDPQTTQLLHKSILKTQKRAPSHTFNFLARLDLREIIQNARQGSIRAKLALLTWRILNYSDAGVPVPMDLKNAFLRIRKECRAFDKIQKVQGDLRKKALAALDVAPNQIDELIASNNRKGVAELFRAYLPWEEMEPVETQYWESWLASLVGQEKKQRSLLLFRGLEGGQFKVNGKGQPFFLVPFLIHNQGTYNRRLRSLSTLGKKIETSWISNKKNLLEPVGMTTYEIGNLIKAGGLTVKLRHHATNPAASPFLSWSQSSNVAEMFAEGSRAAAIRLPQGHVVPNFVSPISSEFEWLSGVIFPDQVVLNSNTDSMHQLVLQEKDSGLVTSQAAMATHAPGQVEGEWKMVSQNKAYLFFVEESKAKIRELLFPTVCESQLE